MDFKDLDIYNGDLVHDGGIDLYNYENIGNPNVFDETDIDNFINNWD